MSWIASMCPKCNVLVEITSTFGATGRASFHFKHCDVDLTEPAGLRHEADVNAEALGKLTERVRILRQ